MRKEYMAAEEGSGLLDGLSLEWEYFMVHDDSFTGIIGYVLADPREYLGGDAPLKLMPSGMNIAVAGQWDPNAGGEPRMVSDFVNFKPSHTKAGEDSMTVVASDCCANDDVSCIAETCDNWCKLTPFPAEEMLHLEGQTSGVAYDIEVTNGWPARKGLGLDPSRLKKLSNKIWMKRIKEFVSI